MKTPLVIDQQKALEDILGKMYWDEFEVEEGVNRHPQGINFYQWLYNRKLITAENLAEIEDEIVKERQSDPDYY